MGLRTLAFVFGVAAALSAQIAVALGLGEIKLNSTLNQPLDAEIQLLQVRDLAEPEILVGLASMEDFRRVGVDRPFFLSDLQFNVDLQDADNPVVRVTSKKPVREPFLNFVVQAQWPSGRLLREYTLLMDLPVFSDDKQAQPVQAPSQERASEAAQTQPAQNRKEQESQRPESRDTSAEPDQERQAVGPTAGSTYGPVKANDTLWDIAVAARPDRSISVQQTMIAIQRANPGAFINNNINLLRRGQVLRIPTVDEMATLTTREAINEVAYQNQQWSSGASSTAERPQLEGSRSYTSGEATSGDVEGRVKLTSPEDYSDSAAGRGTGAGDGSTDALENELAATLEELDKTRSENADLKSRLESLEAQIDTMERLVDVSNEEMRALQLAAQQREEAAAEQTAQPATATDATVPEATSPEATSPEITAPEATGEQTGEAAADKAVAADSQPADTATGETPTEEPGSEDQSSQEQQAEVVEATPPEAIDSTRVVRAAPEPEKTLLDLAIDNILYLALALLALLIAVALFLRSRKKADEEEFDDFLAESEAEEWQETESYDDNDLGDDDFQPLDQDDDLQDTDLFESEDEELPEQETEDAVAEAEIYIALAKYDQAEDILLRALEKEPQDTAIRLKLLELYATQQDVENFDAHYAKLRVLDDPSATSRAQELRQKIAGAPPFDESQYDTGAFAAAVGASAAVAAGRDHDDFDNEDLGLDLDLDSFDEPAEDAGQLDEEINASLNESEDDLSDFDLDLELDDEPTIATSAEADKDDLDFDFDLELEDEPAATQSVTTPVKTDDDEFDFDLELDDEATPEDVTLIRAGASEELAEAMGDEDDLESFTALTESDLEDVADDAAGLVLTDHLDAGIVKSSMEDNATDEEDDAGIDFELDSVATDTSEPELLEDTLEDDLESSFATAGSEEDELDIDAEMDLSALDEELDAITSSLDTGGSSSAIAPDDELELDEDVASGEEPVTDLDDLDLMPDTASTFDSTSDDFDLEDIDPESEDDSDLGFLSDSDETATKLDLARAYIEMGDHEGAKDILDEIMQEGSEEQRKEAQQLQERV